MHSRLKGWPNRILVTILYLFLLAPILVVLGISFDSQSNMAFPPKGFSLQWYEKLAHNQEFITGFKVSVITAGGVAMIALLIGVSVALAITRYDFPGRDALAAFFLSPLLVPAIVLGLALLLVLSPLKITGTYAGLIVAHLSITTPYVIRTSSMSLLTLNRSCGICQGG